MSESESLKRAVEADPTAFDRRFDELRRNLDAEDPRRRMDAGRAIRAAAKADPALVEPHRELLFELLADANDSVVLSGAVGIAEVAADSPGTVTAAVPDLIATLEEAHAPAIEEATLRALKRIGEWSPEAVAEADGVIAEKLRTATPPVRIVIVSFVVDAVVENPSQFPETVAAIEEALEADLAGVRKHAAVAISQVAAADRSAVSSLPAVLEPVEAMEARERAKPLYEGESVGDAADRLRDLSGDGSESGD